MQCVKPRAKGQGRPNMVHNAKEKTSKGRQKYGTTRWTNSQALALGLAHDLKHVWCELEDRLKMMLEK